MRSASASGQMRMPPLKNFIPFYTVEVQKAIIRAVFGVFNTLENGFYAAFGRIMPSAFYRFIRINCFIYDFAQCLSRNRARLAECDFSIAHNDQGRNGLNA